MTDVTNSNKALTLHDYQIGLPASERTIPVEANEALRLMIESSWPGVIHPHALRVQELQVALEENDEIRMLFDFRADSEPMLDLLDRALEKALMLLQAENVTAVGIVLDVIQTIIEHPLLRKHLRDCDD